MSDAFANSWVISHNETNPSWRHPQILSQFFLKRTTLCLRFVWLISHHDNKWLKKAFVMVWGLVRVNAIIEWKNRVLAQLLTVDVTSMQFFLILFLLLHCLSSKLPYSLVCDCRYVTAIHSRKNSNMRWSKVFQNRRIMFWKSKKCVKDLLKKMILTVLDSIQHLQYDFW